MTSTARLNLPLIDAGQAQKNITHNEAILALDQLVQASVLAATLTAPPATNSEGDSYIVAAGATGAWSGKAGEIAAFQQGVWTFYPPMRGWLVWVVAQSRIFVWTGSAWADAFNLFTSTLQNMTLLGVGTTATTANPLSAKLNAALFAGLTAAEGGTGDMRLTLNKAAPTNTVSQLYQDGYSGRAETGLCGDDHFHIKVSADGTTWRDALNIDPATGSLALSTALPITSGGSGATTAAGARTGLGLDSYVFRNRLRNGSFSINQRAVSGTVTLAAGQYGHDGVKGGASGCTYTFAMSGLDTMLTVTAGSLILPIDAGLVEGGVYTLGQAGTAQARIWQGTGTSGAGTYASAPFQTTALVAATQTNVEFATGTILRPQFEAGSLATAFERRPIGIELQICQRYFQTTYEGSPPGTVNANGQVTAYFAFSVAAGGYLNWTLPFPVAMRSAPTMTCFAQLTGTSGKASISGADAAWALNASQGRINSMQNIGATATPTGFNLNLQYTASAEI